jgi:hypothetical protein
MLTAMEITGTAGPALVLGVVLGLLLPGLAALVTVGLRRRRAPGLTAPSPPEPEVDDLPGFLESPPGSTPAADVPPPAWPALSAPPGPAAAPPPEPARSRDGGTRSALLAAAVTALLLVGAAAAVAIGRADRPVRSTAAPTAAGPTRTMPAGDLTAQLTFGGIVLERRAVGVTVAYPRVRVTVRDGRPAAELELPTFNCLRDTAPEDPVAAGCSRTVPEYAELAAPELGLRPDRDGFRVSGAFPTFLRPNGSAPVPTGRVYQLAVDVAPRDGSLDEGGEPATGRFELGGERVAPGAEGPNEITYGG